MANRPLLTVHISVNERRDLQITAQRHGLDPLEMRAAAGFLAAGAWNLVEQLLAQRPVPPTDQKPG